MKIRSTYIRSILIEINVKLEQFELDWFGCSVEYMNDILLSSPNIKCVCYVSSWKMLCIVDRKPDTFD